MKRLSSWLLLVNSVAGANKTARMRIWRALKAGGAAALRDGVYLLPRSARARAVFDEQVREVVSAGGSAHVLGIVSEDEAQERAFIALFDRAAEYVPLLSALHRCKARIARLDEGEARRELAGLGRELDALVAIDFFPGAMQQQVEAARADAEAAWQARHSPGEPHAMPGQVPPRDRARYRDRVWATRARPWVDRLASAWLIRRFIDPGARLLWLESPDRRPKRAIGFDFDGAEFTHVGARVTFEVLVASFGLVHDRALARIGAMVHFLDVGGVPVPEAAGFASILAGMRALPDGDDALLARASGVLDAMYLAFGDPAGESP